MSRIRGRGNKETGLALAKLLRADGIAGWRRQQVIRLPATKRRARRSRPTNIRTDFIFPKQRVAVFVDGCFWHGCPKHSPPAKWLKKNSMPANPPSPHNRLRRASNPSTSLRTGRAFWKEKLKSNKLRDRFVNRELRKRGWRVVRIWEHELGQTSSQQSAFSNQRVIAKIRQALADR